jgi:voltage-gated potassium channel
MERLQLAAPTADDELRQIWRRLIYAAILFHLLLVLGTLGYRIIKPGTSWMDALYMTVITLTTVGYGEIVDLSGHPLGRLFTISLLIVGFGAAAYFVSSATALVVEGHLHHVFWKRRMQREVEGFTGHYIICGYSEAAVHAAEELEAVGREAVMICDRDELVPMLRARLPTVTFLLGDPSSDAALEDAGVQRAAGVIAAAETDKDNIVIALTARQANPKIRIVAQVTAREMEAKLRRVGADSVVSTELIGGLRIASEMVRPTAVNFLDQMLRDRSANLRVDEVRIPANASVIGSTIAELDLSNRTKALLLAYRNGAGEWRYNPAPDQPLDAAGALIFMGAPAEIDAVRRSIV